MWSRERRVSVGEGGRSKVWVVGNGCGVKVLPAGSSKVTKPKPLPRPVILSARSIPPRSGCEPGSGSTAETIPFKARSQIGDKVRVGDGKGRTQRRRKSESEKRRDGERGRQEGVRGWDVRRRNLA